MTEKREKMVVPEEIAERLPILAGSTQGGSARDTAVYTRRWYVLLVFCLGSFSQALVWNTWGPITESAEHVLNWEDSNIGMLANYGNIAFLFTVMPMCYFMDVKGLRISLLICSFLVLVGTGIRCITLEPVPATWLANICAVLNGIGGTVPFAGPAAVSSVWFPPDQRATATAIVSFSNYLGVALAFVIGPQMVSSPTYRSINSTVNVTSNFEMVPDLGNGRMVNTFHAPSIFGNVYLNRSHREVTNMSTLKSDIQHYLYMQAGLGALFFILVVIYFPARPPKPPSTSASVKRTDYVKVSLYAACILIGILVNGGIPLFYEIACEASYPTAEGVTGGFLTLVNNLFGICFLFVMLIPNIGTSWMNQVLLASTVVALPLLFVFPERYRRTDLDITINIQPNTGDLQTAVKVDDDDVDDDDDDEEEEGGINGIIG